ncbi:hypothetical protein DVH05_016092 [Phytophthora capsici]|nr:hypothetical protein DVH05_016092 [Phytophthora capsici]
MVCLTVGNGLLFDLSVAGSYPIYMKDSMLNTNPGFDYGAFRSLAAKVNSNSSTVSAFAFSFTEAGTYVFGNSLNAAAQTIVVVMKAGTSCPTEAPIVPLNEKNLITVSAKRRTDDIILAPDWGLIVGLLAGLFGVVIALIAGLYYFRAKSWTNTAVKSVQGYRAKNKLANLAAMHSKGTVAVTNDTDQSESVSGALLGTDAMTLEKKQFHPGKQEQVKGATMEYRPDFERWDEEDLDLRELVDRLQFHHEAVTKSFEDQKGGVKELMQRLQAEAVELKRLFVNALVTSDLMSPEAKNPTAALESEVLETSTLSGRPRSRSVAGREKFLLENLERDLQDRNRFDQKKNVMMDSVSAGLHEIEGWGAQLAELTGAIVQDMSSQLDDRAPERTSSKEETCLEHVRSVLGELKTLLGSDPMTQTSSSLMHLVEAEKGRREVGNFVLEASQRYFTAHPTIDGVDQELSNGVQRVLELHDDVEKAQNKEDEALFQPLQSLQKFGAALPQVLAAIEDLESSFHRELDAVREEQNPVKEHAVQAQMQSRLSKLMKEVAAGAKRVNEKVSKEAPRTVKLRHGAQQAENALSRFLGSAKEQWATADQEQRDRSAASAFNINDPESAPPTPSPPPEDQAVANLRDKTLFEVKDLLIKLTTLLQRNGGASISASQQLDFAPQLPASTDPRVTADEKRSGAWTSDESYPQDSVAENERQRGNLTSDLRKTQPPTSLVASTHIDPATRQAANGEMERDHVLHREVEDANDLRTQHDEEEQSLESQFREEELAIEQEYLRELSSLEKEFGFGSGDEADGDATEPPENLFDAFYKDMEGDEHLPPRLSETRKTEAEMSEVLMDDNADIIAQLNDVYSEAWNNRVQILAMEEALRKEQLNERIRRKRIAQQRLEFPDNLNALTLEALESKDAILEEIVKKQDEMDAQEQEAINSAVNHLRKQVEDCQGRDGQSDRDAITKLVTGARNCAKEDRAKAEKAIAHAESELQKLLNEYEHGHSAMRKDVEAERLRLEEKLKCALAKRHRQRGSPQNVEDDDELLEQLESGNSDLREDFETELEAFTDSAIKELRDKYFQVQGEIEAQKIQGVISMAVADAQLAYLDGLSTERVTTKMDDNSLSQLEVTEELLEALAVKIPMHIEQLTQEKVDKLRAAYVLSCAERRRELEADAAMRRAKLADRMNRRRRTKERDAIDEKAQKPSTTKESETIDEQEQAAIAEITEDLRTATEALDETERKMCEALAQTLASTLQKYGAEIDGQIREEREKSHDEVGSKTFVVNALDALVDEASQRAETEAQARAAIEREFERMTHDRSKSLAALTQSLEVEKRRQEQLLKQRVAQRREQQQHLLPLGSSPEKVSEMNAVLTKQEVVEKLHLEGQLEMEKQRAFDEEREKQRDRESQLEQQLRDAFVAETAAAAMKEAVVQARSEYLEMGSNDEGLASLLQLWNARQAQKHLTPTGIVPDQKSGITTSDNSMLERLHEEHDREWEALKARHEDETQRRKNQLAQRLQRKRQMLRNNTALSPTDRARAESALDREQEHESQAIKASAASLDRAITLAIQGAKDRASEIITGSLASNTADLDAALETTRRQHEEGQRKLRGDLETERRKQEQLLRERLRQRRAARRDGAGSMVKAEAEEAEEADMKQKLEEKLCAQEDEAWAALREREQQELDAVLAPLEAVVSQRLDDADLAERRARQELSRLAEEHNRHLSELRGSLEAEKKRQQLALRDKLQRKRDRRGADGVSVSDEEALEMERQAMEALDASFEADLATAEAEAGKTRREKEIELLAEICACSANRTAEEAALMLLDGARLEAERVRAEYEAALASRLQRSAAADALRREEMAKRLAERKLKRRQQREQQALQETTGIIAPLKPPFGSRHNDREDDGSLDQEIANVQAAHARGVRSRQEQLDAETAARRAALAARLDHKRRAAMKGGESRPSEAEMEKALLLEEQQELAAIERDRALREKELKAEAARERELLTKTMREADESGAADIERQLAACKQAHDAEAAKLEEALRAERARQELALKQRLAAKRQRRAADGGDTEVNGTSDQEAQEVQAALSEQERAARQQLADRQQQELADVARKLEQEAEAQRQAAFDLQAAAERELKRLEEEHTRERRALQTALLADKQKREDQLREKLVKKKAARQAKGFESQQDAIEEEIALAALQEEISREQAVALVNERERQEAAMSLAAAELQEAAAATAKAAAASRQAQEEAARVAADFDRHRGESQQLEAVDIAHSKRKLADRLAEKKRKQQLMLQQLEMEQVDNDDATRILQEEAERLRLEAQIEAQLAACREAHDAEAAKLRESLQAERERQEHALQERIARRKEKRSLAYAQASARVDLKAAEELERKQQLEEEAALATALAAQEQEAWETIQRKQEEDIRVLQEQKHQQEQERAKRQHQLAQKEMNRLQEEHERELRALTTSLAQEQARQEEKLQQRIAQRRARKQRQEEEAAATSAKEQQSIADAEEAARLAAERDQQEALAEAQAQAEAEAEEKERQEIAARLAQKLEEERARQRREKDELEAKLAREAEELAATRAAALALQFQQQALETGDKMAREFDTNLRELRETHSADGAAQKARLESRIAAKKARKLRELEEKRELERQRLHTRQQQEAEEAARAEQEREAAEAEAVVTFAEELAPVQPSPDITLLFDDETAPKAFVVRQQPTEEDDLVAELRGKLELEAEDRRRDLEREKRVELERLTQDELRQITEIDARVKTLLADERAAMIELLTTRLQSLPIEMVKQREAAEREHAIQLQRLTLLLEGRGQQQKSRVRARMVQKRVLIEDEFSRKAKLVTAAMNQRFMQEKMGLHLKKQTPIAPMEETHVSAHEETQGQDENQSHSVLSAELVKRLEEMLEDRLVKIEALVTEFQVKAQAAPPAPIPPKEMDPEEPSNSLAEYQIAIAEAVAIGCRYEKRVLMDKQSVLLVDSFGVLDASVVTSELPEIPVNQLDDRMRARLRFVELLLHSVSTKSEPTVAGVVVVEHFGRGNNGDADYASFSPPKQGQSEKGTLFLSRAALQELSTGQLAVVILHALAQGHAHTSNLTEPQFICHLYKLLVRCYQGLFAHFQQERDASTATAKLPRKSGIAEVGKTISSSDKPGSGQWQARLQEVEGFLTRLETRNSPSQSILRSESSRFHLLTKQREAVSGSSADLWQQEQVQILQEKLDSAEKLYLQVLRQHEQQTQSVEYWQDLLAEQRDAEYEDDTFDEEGEAEGEEDSKEQDLDAVERQRQREVRAQELQGELERTSQALEGTRKERDELFAQCQQLRDQLNELRGGRTTN